jgi:hypothetical protein
LERMRSQWPVWRMVFCFRWIQNPDGGNGPNLRAHLILPCLVPLMLWFIKTIIKAVLERKLAIHVMML